MRRIVSWFLVSQLTGLLFCVTPAPAQTLKTGYTSKTIFFLPFFVAEKKGFYLAEDIKVELIQLGTPAVSLQALIAGQADAEIADFPVAAYSASQSDGALEVIPNQIDPGPYGIAVRPDSTALAEALREALEAITEDGTYDAILEKWNLSAGALE